MDLELKTFIVKKFKYFLLKFQAASTMVLWLEIKQLCGSFRRALCAKLSSSKYTTKINVFKGIFNTIAKIYI